MNVRSELEQAKVIISDALREIGFATDIGDLSALYFLAEANSQVVQHLVNRQCVRPRQNVR